jgi:hypothetical protein
MEGVLFLTGAVTVLVGLGALLEGTMLLLGIRGWQQRTPTSRPGQQVAPAVARGGLQTPAGRRATR